MSALAKKYTDDNIAAIRTLTSQLDSTHLPIGWKGFSLSTQVKGEKGSDSTINLLILLAGWAIAAGCISMGVPFWFDMLNKLVNVRRSVEKPKPDK
jgi:hypothetical protein